ncbi:LysR family transcriptional regulator [Candidatus Protochlamydia amoebophila]|uniref:LysR family transcriptional regulator n=1 Tax=Candidatus Protochlamydia amoebophila TaxID=362787 RepID=UPI001E4CFE03|nr:LysR family transcriptional regulator [Candidatus Protochlamydia amoebophila]
MQDRQKSISKAAKENFVSQSAISQAIHKLEITLGKQLITHEKKRFQLKIDGLLLLDKCKQIFLLYFLKLKLPLMSQKGHLREGYRLLARIVLRFLYFHLILRTVISNSK